MSILDSAKEIADLIKKMGDIELYRKIVELEGEIIDITRTKRELEERCEKLDKQLSFGRTLTFRPPVYYAEGDEIPFCPTCYETDHSAYHLIGPDTDSAGDVSYNCNLCGNTFYTKKRPSTPGDDFAFAAH
jgi:hypothetical protein